MGEPGVPPLSFVGERVPEPDHCLPVLLEELLVLLDPVLTERSLELLAEVGALTFVRFGH
jgi:hypothetical protein